MDEERGGALGHSREVGQAGPVLPWCGEHPFPSSPVTFLPSSRLSVFRGCQDRGWRPIGLRWAVGSLSKMRKVYRNNACLKRAEMQRCFSLSSGM